MRNARLPPVASFFAALSLVGPAAASADTLTVTNTNEGGAGSRARPRPRAGSSPRPSAGGGAFVIRYPRPSAILVAAAADGRGEAMEEDRLRDFAARYTAAWCGGDPARVASFFAENGSLKINDGEPSVGRSAITEAARGFMSAFPNMVVSMDALEPDGSRFRYRWTLTGTNTGPGGTGRRVRIRGYEDWTIGSDGLIARSLGHFDEADYRRQLAGE